MDMLLIALLFLSLCASFILYQGLKQLKAELVKLEEDNADRLSDQLTYQLEVAKQEQGLQLARELNLLQTTFHQQFHDLRTVLNQELLANRNQADQQLERLQTGLTQSVKELQHSNEERLNDMRQTVAEKLDQTLHQRLKLSFEQVSQQLESVNQGLGEMKSVARDVGTLNKVLSNTKTRGIMGELQLGQIIEDILTESQYEREFVTVPGSNNRVEYAIKLPGQGDGYVYLPIDSKFPLEAYYQLEEAYELGDKEQVDLHRKALLSSIKRFAKDIKHKYLKPPATTQFGILFLPTEGLYAEVVRQASFFDQLRREESILVAGPSTLSALLNSLSVGFKTLNLQKNADDISQILGQVKTEFGRYQGMLAKTQKQLNTASQTLDSLLTTRTKAVLKVLDNLETQSEGSPLTYTFSEQEETFREGDDQ